MIRLGLAWLAAAAFAASLGYFLYAYFVLFDASRTGHGDAGRLASIAADVALFTVFALHHSVFARTPVKTLVRQVVPAELERAVYTLLASALFVVVCWLWRPVEGIAWALVGPWRWVGLGAQAAGIVVTLIGARALDVLDLAGVRQVLRTQAHAMPLKIDGVYGFVRHPLYFAWLLLVFGAPVMTGTRLTFAVVSGLYLALAVPFEERSLIETFGPDYASYQRKVPWRMVPGLY